MLKRKKEKKKKIKSPLSEKGKWQCLLMKPSRLWLTLLSNFI